MTRTPTFFLLLSTCVLIACSPAPQPNAGGEHANEIAHVVPAATPTGLGEEDFTPDELPETVRQALLEVLADGNPQLQLSAELAEQLAALRAKRASDLRKRWLGRQLPIPTLSDLDGRTHVLAGRRTLVNFWATWCTPCIEAIPLFEALAASTTDLTVITISHDHHRSDLDAFLEYTPLSFPVVFNPDESLTAALGLTDWPTTLVLDTQGRVEHVFHTVHSLEDLRAKTGLD